MPVNGVVMLTVLLLLSGIQYGMHYLLAAQQMNIAAFISWVTIAAMLLVMLLVWLTNRSTVRRYLRS